MRLAIFGSCNRHWRRAACLSALVMTGCTEIRETQPQRTATEQLLISTAVDQAVRQIDLHLPEGAAVYFDERYFEAYDEGYALGSLRAYLLRAGVRLVTARDEADAIVEVRSGSLSINRKVELLGLPAIPLPIPADPQLETPEVSAFRREQQLGVAKIALVAMDARTGALMDDDGPVFGIAWLDNWTVLGFGWRANGPIPDRALP